MRDDQEDKIYYQHKMKENNINLLNNMKISINSYQTVREQRIIKEKSY